MAKVISIQKIKEKLPQKCITVAAEDGLFIANDLWTHNSDQYVLRFFTDLKSRVESRMKGNYFGRTILDSSPNDIENPIDKYAMFEAEKSPRNYVVKGSRWQWCPEDFKDVTNTFPVFKGGNGRPPQILQTTEGFSTDDIVQVPSELRQFFEDDLVKALKDIGGIPSGNLDKLFYDHEKLERIFHPQLKSISQPIRADSRSAPYNLIWNGVRDTLFNQTGKKYTFYYKPDLPRVFHIDQSISGDMAAIAVCHVERKPFDVTQMRGDFDPDRDLMYVIDFIIPIHPYNGRINLDAIKEFIVDLTLLGRMTFIKGSFDTFQSEANIQGLIRYNIDMENVSVDKTMDPYLFLAQCIEQNSFRVGKNLILKNNLKSLRIVPREKGSLKIDHTLGDTIHPGGADLGWDTGLIGMNAKDVSDAVCGAVYQAKKYLAIDGRSLSQTWNDEEVVLNEQQKRARLDSLRLAMGL